MPVCDRCSCELAVDLPSDLCPNCGERLRRCPWCGETLPWDATGRVTSCCRKPAKIQRAVGHDVTLLSRGAGIDGGPLFLRVVEAIYHGGSSTLYRVKPTKRLGDPFLLDGAPPPEFLSLKEIVSDPRNGQKPLPPEVAERYRRLRHAGLPKLYGVWREEDRYFILQDWTTGETSAQRFFHGTIPAPDALLRIAGDLVAVLLALSAPDIELMHGDITPYNLLITSDQRPVLIDLGSLQLLSAARRPKELTPHYAPIEFYPPEHLPPAARRSDPIHGDASDRYMLGATLFALACGREASEIHPDTGLPLVVPPPERAGGAAQMRLGAMRPDLPRGFTTWVDRLLSLYPEDRYASHEEAGKELRLSWGSSIRVGGRRSAGSTVAAGSRARREKVRSISSGDSRSTPGESRSSVGNRLRMPERSGHRFTLPSIPFPVSVSILFFLLLLAFVGWNHPGALTAPWRWFSLLRADLAMGRGRPADALRLLDHAGDVDWEARILRAKARLEAGAPMNALAEIERAARDPRSPDRVRTVAGEMERRVGRIEHNRGLRFMERGERYPAYRSLRQAARLGVTSPEGDLALTRLAMERGESEAAHSYLERYLKARPDSLRGRLLAIQVALDLEKLDQAYAHALRVRRLSEEIDGSAASSDAERRRLDRAIGRVASALLLSVSPSPANLRGRKALLDGIEKLTMARSLRPAPELDRRINRYYDRLRAMEASRRSR